MIQRKIKYTLSSLLVLGLSACTSEDLQGTFDRTADGPIEFTVGVEASPVRRSLTRDGESATPSYYYAMQEGTQVRLKVDGTWKGKTPEAISQKRTCTTVAAESGSAINALTFTEDETLYWDDYGTGDPENTENKAKGLSVLAVAVDGKEEAPVVDTDEKWQSLDWPVVTSGDDVLRGDILVSNNLIGDNAYKFEKPIAKHPGNLMFSHPLSKITINLTAADGFTKGTVGATNYKFENDPTVTLTNATTLAGMANNGGAYALTKGTISIASATATPEETKANVIAGTTSTTDKNITVIKQAIVYPGTQLGATDDAVIAVVQADGNVYFIKAAQIHAAMNGVGHTDHKTQAGYNYILNITLKKSGVSFTATVAKWNDVKSASVDPRINVTTSIGAGTDKPTEEKAFAFYRSEDIDKGYSNGSTPTMKTDGTVDWTNQNILFWSNHNQHYHFRGIYPAETTIVTDETNNTQYVEVSNGGYDANTFPSNFLMGMPEIAAGTLCGNPDHEQVDMSIHGICAREANINLNFRYMMSQVEVVLSTVDAGSNQVDLNNVKVELVNVHNTGHILLKDRSAVVTGTAADFELPQVENGSHQYLGVIVPQALTYTTAGAATNLRFRITVTNSDSTKDIYYADVAPILETGKSTKIAPNGKWESGQHYVYNLKLSKTQVQVSATLTNWNTVTANENVCF